MTVVLDSSAVLAMVLNETGHAVVRQALDGAVISAVNLSEVYTKVVEKGLDVDAIRLAMLASPVRVVAFGDGHAFLAGKLRESTRSHGLSLGDRACLATAMLERGSVLTADKAWLKLGLDIEIISIR